MPFLYILNKAITKTSISILTNIKLFLFRWIWPIYCIWYYTYILYDRIKCYCCSVSFLYLIYLSRFSSTFHSFVGSICLWGVFSTIVSTRNMQIFTNFCYTLKRSKFSKIWWWDVIYLTEMWLKEGSKYKKINTKAVRNNERCKKKYISEGEKRMQQFAWQREKIKGKVLLALSIVMWENGWDSEREREGRECS